MCKPASMVLTKDKVFWSQSTDSHERIITEFGLKADGPRGPNIARIEITPPVDGAFETPAAEWVYNLDQDNTPSWYDREEAEARVRAELPAWMACKLLLSGNHGAISENKAYIGGTAVVGAITGTAAIGKIGGHARVEYINQTTYVGTISGNATIRYIYDRASVCLVDGNAKIGHVQDRARICSLEGRATVESLCDSSMIGTVGDDAVVKQARDSSLLRYVCTRAVVRELEGRSRIETLQSRAQVNRVGVGAQILNVFDQAKVLVMEGAYTRFTNSFSTKLKGPESVIVDASGLKPKVHLGSARARTVTNIKPVAKEKPDDV